MNTLRQGSLFSLQIPSEWNGMTIEELFFTIWKLPKKLLHRWRMDNLVKLDGKSVNWRMPMPVGSRLSVPFFQTAPFGAEPVYSEPSILYEDDHMIIADKPAGMKTHPNEAGETNTLLNEICYHVSLSGDTLPVRHVHRLDEWTSGAVLFAKHEAAYAVFSRLLEEKTIYRTYYAVVDGRLKKNSGTIKAPIGKDRHHPSRRRISPSGQNAVTHFKVMEKKDVFSLVECRLETGRTHQIRVHLASIGHPIAGDSLYGGSSTFDYQLLHAAKLTVPNPFTNDLVSAESPVPILIKELFSSTQ
ncbi:RluA family pseudouridine synthase [Domibacillus epiphyticus]|uniref:Pseudouridine synthase n=1 Tax=Domibacillus epiphyticus TaxID=1714355 RepID=A0A1V2A840_9BACI|nr:RluA family pseudouridine synthase [Domibacillus epiphyticus]OMP67163.1 RNA pseudouridine synthase [Domibacillus epiphyticus]